MVRGGWVKKRGGDGGVGVLGGGGEKNELGGSSCGKEDGLFS